ncbi:hypothetical protein D3C80_1063590 [compost metagenome]
MGRTYKASDQATVVQGADPEGDVQPFTDQILVLIAQLQVYLHVRVVPEKVRQSGSDLQATETDRRTDFQRTGHLFPAGLEAVFCRIHGSEDDPAFVVIALTFVRQR